MVLPSDELHGLCYSGMHRQCSSPVVKGNALRLTLICRVDESVFSHSCKNGNL